MLSSAFKLSALVTLIGLGTVACTTTPTETNTMVKDVDVHAVSTAGVGQKIGTILLSLYSMFGLGEYSVWYFQPSCFVLGALWYGCTAIVFYILKPTLAVQDNLARCFNQVADLLNAKARLFDPDNRDNVEALLYDLSLQTVLWYKVLTTPKAHY